MGEVPEGGDETSLVSFYRFLWKGLRRPGGKWSLLSFFVFVRGWSFEEVAKALKCLFDYWENILHFMLYAFGFVGLML